VNKKTLERRFLKVIEAGRPRRNVSLGRKQVELGSRERMSLRVLRIAHYEDIRSPG
jgi:hypothetical protein